MSEATVLLLPDEKRAILARAGKTFPGEKLNDVVVRTLSEISKNQISVEFYEIRRVDVPWAFDALLKYKIQAWLKDMLKLMKKSFGRYLGLR